MRTVRTFVLLACLFPVVFIGCGPSTPAAGQPTAMNTEEKLKDLGGLIADFTAERKKPPQKLADLAEFEPSHIQGHKAVVDGEIVVRYGIAVDPAKPGTAIVAYEKAAATAGGLALFQDGTVKTVTAADIAAVKK
jgi:hypothetical protein